MTAENRALIDAVDHANLAVEVLRDLHALAVSMRHLSATGQPEDATAAHRLLDLLIDHADAWRENFAEMADQAEDRLQALAAADQVREDQP